MTLLALALVDFERGGLYIDFFTYQNYSLLFPKLYKTAHTVLISTVICIMLCETGKA